MNAADDIRKQLDRGLATLQVVRRLAEHDKTSDNADMVDALALAADTLGEAIAEIDSFDIIERPPVPRDPTDRLAVAMKGEA